MDSVGLRVGLSCFQLDPEETRPVLLDERGATRDVDLGVTPGGRPVEGAPVLEPLEHSVLEKSLDGGFTEGVPVLEPLEHSVPEKALDDRPMAGIAVLDLPKHAVLDVNMNSLWMAPWDAGGTFQIGSLPEVVIRRDRLRWIVQLSCRPAFGGLTGTCVIDLYAGVSTTPVEIMVEYKMPDFLELFHVSPVSPGFLTRPSRDAPPVTPEGVLLPSMIDAFSDSDLGAPMAYAQCELIPGSDTSMSLPVFLVPSGFSARPDQSSIQTVLALGTSSHPDGDPLPPLLPWIWRTARYWRRAYRVVRFDLRRTADSRSRMGIRPLAYSFITHGSWSLSVRRGRLASCTTHQRSGSISSEGNKGWPLPSTCNGTRALCCPIFRYCRSLQCR